MNMLMNFSGLFINRIGTDILGGRNMIVFVNSWLFISDSGLWILSNVLATYPP